MTTAANLYNPENPLPRPIPTFRLAITFFPPTRSEFLLIVETIDRKTARRPSAAKLMMYRCRLPFHAAELKIVRGYLVMVSKPMSISIVHQIPRRACLVESRPHLCGSIFSVAYRSPCCFLGRRR